MVVRKPDVLRSFLEDEQARLQAVIAQMEAEGTANLGYGNHMADDASEAFDVYCRKPFIRRTYN